MTPSLQHSSGGQDAPAWPRQKRLCHQTPRHAHDIPAAPGRQVARGARVSPPPPHRPAPPRRVRVLSLLQHRAGEGGGGRSPVPCPWDEPSDGPQPPGRPIHPARRPRPAGTSAEKHAGFFPLELSASLGSAILLLSGTPRAVSTQARAGLPSRRLGKCPRGSSHFPAAVKKAEQPTTTAVLETRTTALLNTALPSPGFKLRPLATGDHVSINTSSNALASRSLKPGTKRKSLLSSPLREMRITE